MEKLFATTKLLRRIFLYAAGMYVKFFLLTGILISIMACSTSQKVAGDSKTDKESKTSDYDKALENTVAYDGLFTIYQDTLTGATKLAIREDQLNKEFIYFGSTQDGAVETNHFKGMYRDNKIFKIRKYFDKVEFVVQNTSFYFPEDSPLKKASESNISDAVLLSEKIEAENKDEKLILINGNSIFLSENFNQIKPSPDPKPSPGEFSLGKLSEDKTRYVDIRSYPENTNVIVNYVYESPYAVGSTSKAITDKRFVTITFQHSFIEVPENDYKSRFYDPRVGYFMTQQDDQVSTSATPYRDLIHRWNLVKKDPDAELSEPVQPIVWWIENTTPHNLRETIAEATLKWNDAFEKAGFKNAIQVKVQPDDADWDAADIRYNVLRWTSSPNPPFGGYGPSFVNPRTGEILGADIMLEWAAISRFMEQEDLLLGESSFNFKNQSYNDTSCSFGEHMHQNFLYGRHVLETTGAASDLTEFQKQGLSMLILHELGHTFGLTHNMQASTLHSAKAIQNKNLTQKAGLTASVMDYTAVNVDRNPANQGHYFDIEPGVYDQWAIEFGYYPALKDRTKEENRQQRLLSRSTEPELAYGNDADDMRSPGKGIDPRIMVGDITSDPVQYSVDRIKLTDSLMNVLLEKYGTKEGQSYEELREAYMTLMYHRAGQFQVISRQIGGVYRDGSFIGQEQSAKPFTPVPAQKQKESIAYLEEYLFAPNAFDTSHEVYNYLQLQRRGFNFGSSTEDPKIHDLVLSMQARTLAHLFHPVTMQRVTDSRTYGNSYALAEVVNDVTEAIFRADSKSNVNSFRQNLQVEYVKILTEIMQGDNYDHIAKSAAVFNLQNIKAMIRNKNNINNETKAHTAHIDFLIDKAFEH